MYTCLIPTTVCIIKHIGLARIVKFYASVSLPIMWCTRVQDKSYLISSVVGFVSAQFTVLVHLAHGDLFNICRDFGLVLDYDWLPVLPLVRLLGTAVLVVVVISRTPFAATWVFLPTLPLMWASSNRLLWRWYTSDECRLYPSACGGHILDGDLPRGSFCNLVGD